LIQSVKGQSSAKQAFFEKFFPEEQEFSSEESTGPTFSSGKSDTIDSNSEKKSSSISPKEEQANLQLDSLDLPSMINLYQAPQSP
jgi:hypothetical protein